jgi:polysaccharide export outer membrane protein
MVYRVFITLIALLAASAVAAQTNYRIGPGDTVRIEVLEDPSLNREVLVLPDGSLSFPLAGAVRASGQTTSQLESALASALAPNFATSPTVSVSVAGLAPVVTGPSVARTIDVYVMGEVGNGGGLLEVEPGTTVLQALALSGGFSPFAATKRIQLRRTDPQTGQQNVYTINYRAIEQGATNIGNSVLADGDVILVPERRLFE